LVGRRILVEDAEDFTGAAGHAVWPPWMRGALRFRSVPLVLGILDYVYSADEPVVWDELVELFSSEGLSYRTVENTIYDLIAFGALHRVGKASTRRGGADTRTVRPTPLGRAWLAGETGLPITAWDDD
jgi:hypothetical protein